MSAPLFFWPSAAGASVAALLLHRARRRRAAGEADEADEAETQLLLSELRRSHRGAWLALSDAAGASLRWPLLARYLRRRKIKVPHDHVSVREAPAGAGAGKATGKATGEATGKKQRARLLRVLLTYLRGHVGGGGLEVRPSTVPAAGQGLFAARHFAGGALLCVYRGTAVSLVEAMRRKEAGEHGDYVMGGFGANVRIDAGPHPEVLARYINDDLSETPRHNVKFVKLKAQQCALVVALRDIEAGEELFAFYGQGYWKGRRQAAAQVQYSTHQKTCVSHTF